ncbi:hypothetical protein [Thiomicrorhabdus indica]|uniref:hypothetical protein n=1 Tax=Thiomicrorhabdus indica TaxID=2267253 RepID=UPI00102D91E1|nr:hypothetical protein [Thiomicrorhabdus indica]
MSNIDLEKDELATQEMLAMLDDGVEKSDDNTASDTDQTSEDGIDMDDILNSIEAVENESESEEIEDIQSASDDALDLVTEDANTDDLDALDELAEIDALAQESVAETPDEAEDLMAAMQQAEPTTIESQEFDSELDEELHDNLLSEESTESPENFEMQSNNSEETTENPTAEMDDLNLELPDDLITEQQTDVEEAAFQEEEDIDFPEQETMETSESEPFTEENETIVEDIPEETDLTAEIQTEAETEAGDSDIIDEALSVEESIDAIESPSGETAHNEMPSTEEMPAPAGNNYENTAEANTQLQSALDQMMEAIQMNEKMQQYAKQVEATTIKATQMALATAQKAQSQALQTQETIEANFAAAENAFETAQDSGYQLESQELEKFADTTSTEMEAFLSEIREKNRSLNETNQRLAERLASIQTQ